MDMEGDDCVDMVDMVVSNNTDAVEYSVLYLNNRWCWCFIIL